MAVVKMSDLLKAGLHFGHPKHRWNPKTRPYLLGEKDGIYLINLKHTLAGFEAAYTFVRDLVARGGVVLFVGTKKQAKAAIAESAVSCGMPYVAERWLGGMLTNFFTISSRLRKLAEYEAARAAGELDKMPKKEALRLTRRMAKLQRNLGGIKHMTRLPDAIFVIDINKEHLAVREANKLGIPVVALVDTDCDPDLVTYPIPGNDDSIRAAVLSCHVISEAVKEGRYMATRTSLGPIPGQDSPHEEQPVAEAGPQGRPPAAPDLPEERPEGVAQEGTQAQAHDPEAGASTQGTEGGEAQVLAEEVR